MILVLNDGTSREVPFKGSYVGTSAQAVVLEKSDVDAMRRLAADHPVMFNIKMRELASRFSKGGDVMEVSGG